LHEEHDSSGPQALESLSDSHSDGGGGELGRREKREERAALEMATLRRGRARAPPSREEGAAAVAG
jgi:hypothetical protein